MKIARLFLSSLLIAGPAFAAPPDWLADPGNSRWAVDGSKTSDVTVDHSDGTLKPAPGGWQAIGADGQSSNFYVLAGPWDKFHAWLGDQEVLLTVRYFDGGAGTMGLHYDSSDASFKSDPNAPGVWRAPEDYPNGVPLTGSKTWKTLSVRLPLAFFTKRANGGDVRIDAQVKDFVLGGVAFTRVAKGPELPVKQALFVDPTISPTSNQPAEFWTAPVAPFDVAQWRHVTFDMPATVQCEYSTDSGKSWTPFDPKNDLTAIPVVGGGKDRIQFHLKDTGPFHFGGGVLTYQAGPHNTRAVENARMKIEVDPFGIHSIFDKKTGRSIADAPAFHAPLISFLMKKRGAAVPFKCDLYEAVLEKCEVGGSADTPELTLTHLLDNGVRVTSTGKLLPNGQSEWQMTIDNATDFEVAEFRFPVVTGIKPGGDPANDWMFVPKAWGQIMQNPAGDGIWADTQNLCTPMQWTALWGGKQGIYFGIEDSRHEDYSFGYGGDASGGETVAPWQRTLVKPHGQWKSGIYRIALTGGDWHEAADIYRDYAARTIQPTDVTPLVKWQVDAWRLQDSDKMPFAGWDVIEPGGSPLMAANRQMLDGADSGYCGLYPLPCLAWGSLREFSQKLAVRRALGGLYTPYHNFHLWSPSYGHYQRVGSFPKSKIPAGIPIPDDAWYARGATKNYQGQYARDETNYFVQDDMAMASPEWSGWLTDWTRRYIDWGADGMYYDQFNMLYANGWLYPGYDTYGCWMQAEIKTISGIRQASRAKNPYYTSSGEVCNAIYGQYLDLHMTSGVWNRLDIFRYAVPHQLLIDGGWNSGMADTLGGPDRHLFIWQVGARFDHEPPAPYQGILPLRRAVKSLLYDATFRDTVGVTVRDAAGKSIEPIYTYNTDGKWQNAPVSGVIARWFLYDRDGQKGAIVNLINSPVSKGATCAIDTKEFGPVTSAFAVTLDGARTLLAGKQEGDAFTFPVPESKCSSVVLAGHLAPLVEWTIDPAAAPGITRQLHLKLTNVDAGPLSGTATLRLPAGWEIPPAVPFGPIASGQTQSLTIPVNVPSSAAKGRTDIWCDIATPSGNFAAYNLLVVNDPVVADFRGNPGDYHLWLKNLTAAPLSGTISVQGQTGLTVSAPATVALPPDSETNVPVDVKGQDKLPEIGEISASIQVGSQKIDVIRGVMPTVPNRDFEMDGAGDLKPDWWMCRNGIDDGWAYERLHLATGAHGGKYCLQVDPPQAKEKYVYAYPVDSAFRPGAHYRVSVWIKSASATGVYAQINAQLGSGQTGPDWKQFTSEFTCGASPSVYIALRNESSAPAFFDDIVIEEVAPH